MSVHDQTNSSIENTKATGAWYESLVAETIHLDEAGVHAALLSIRVAGVTDDRTMNQTKTLLKRLVSKTDRVEQISSTSFSVLLSPQNDLRETVSSVRSIAQALDSAGIRSSTGFAHRRSGESLLDTWARAEAQLDRAAYQAEHRDGLTV